MADIQTLSIALAAVGIFIAAINSILSNRRADQQRQTELFMNIYNRFQDKEFGKTMFRIETEYLWTDLDEFEQKYGIETNLEVYAEINSIARYFEGVGVLVKEGLIDIILVYELLMQQILVFWEYYGALALAVRVTSGDPKVYDCVEYLYDRIKRMDQPEYPDVVRARARDLAKRYGEKHPEIHIQFWEQWGSTDEARKQYVLDMTRDPQLADLFEQLYHEFKQQQATVST